jgi:hypothetical protein
MRGRPREGLLGRLTIPGRWLSPLALAVALLGMATLVVLLVSWRTSAGWGYDFAAYYDAAQRLAATGSPYQAETLGGPFGPGPAGLYLYSPVLATLLLPASGLEFVSAALLWQVARVGVLMLACALMPVSRNVRLASLGVAALTPGVLQDLNLGNVSVIVTFLAVVSWRYLDSPVSGIALAASLSVRPTMAVVAGWWILRRRLQPVAWTVVAIAVLVALTMPFVGVTGWLDYATVLRNLSGVTGVPRNADLGSFVLNLGAPPLAATLALVAGYGVAVVAVLASLRRDRELGYVVAVAASLVLSPLLWSHYLALLIVPAAFLARRGHPWAIALPLLTWLPYELSGIVALAALLLPFVARDEAVPAATARQR